MPENGSKFTHIHIQNRQIVEEILRKINQFWANCLRVWPLCVRLSLQRSAEVNLRRAILFFMAFYAILLSRRARLLSRAYPRIQTTHVSLFYRNTYRARYTSFQTPRKLARCNKTQLVNISFFHFYQRLTPWEYHPQSYGMSHEHFERLMKELWKFHQKIQEEKKHFCLDKRRKMITIMKALKWKWISWKFYQEIWEEKWAILSK